MHKGNLAVPEDERKDEEEASDSRINFCNSNYLLPASQGPGCNSLQESVTDQGVLEEEDWRISPSSE
jgi:hypothetical protein